MSEAGGTITIGIDSNFTVTSSTVGVAARDNDTGSHFVNFTQSASGNLGLFTDSGFKYQPSTNKLTLDNIDIANGGDILPRTNQSSGNSGSALGASGNKWLAVYAETFHGTATNAQYADLAENYLSDADYEPGTVLVFGGDREVTICDSKGDRRAAGVVTTNPAHLMNSALQGEFVIGLALKAEFLVK